MKKVIFSLAITGLLGFSFSSASAQAVKAGTLTMGAQKEQINLPTPPQFDSPAVNNGVKGIVSLFKEYAPAIRAKDTAKLMEFATKMQAVQKDAITWINQMSDNEKKEFQEYMMQVQKAIVPESATPEAAPATH